MAGQVSKVKVKKEEVKADMKDAMTVNTPTVKKIGIEAKNVFERISKPAMIHMEEKKTVIQNDLSSKLKQEDNQSVDESESDANDNKGQGSNRNSVDGEFGSENETSESEITEVATPDEERLAKMARKVANLVFFTLAGQISFVFCAILVQLGVPLPDKLYWYVALIWIPFPGIVNPIIYLCRGSTKRKTPLKPLSPEAEEAYHRAMSWI